MQLKRLFADDDAVSPVIGVILMVAITVILAAVIGAFVLGIGGDQATAPQATWGTTEMSNTSGVVAVQFEVSGVSGSQPDTGNLYVSAGGTDQPFSGSGQTLGVGDVVNASFQEDSSATVPDGDPVRIVWEEGGNQQIIIEHSLTEASMGPVYKAQVE